MANNPPGLRVDLFYSYSHRDVQHKEAMRKILAALKRRGFLRDWSDARITPGQRISEALQAKLPESDIVAFLFSPDFLDSEECLKEWYRAKELAASGRLVFRVPIIVRECPWQDFLGEDDVKALPLDGKAITTHQDPDSAWNSVYEGIKSVVETIRTTYTPKQSFLADLNDADLPVSKPIALDDIFVFPRLTEHEYIATSDLVRESIVSSLDQLRDLGRSMIHGQDKSGKTALAKQLARSLIRDGQPVLFADLGATQRRPGANFLRRLYEDQFNGDYSLWLQQDNKTLIVDHMNDAPDLIDLIEDCSETFSSIHIFVSTDVFQAFLIDEIRLADFHQIRLDPLTLTQQEKLIRNQLTALRGEDVLTDGLVDKAEDRVNSIIISNKIVPRYPFFVLAILQTYDALMPPSLSITSYGHCYYVFVVASLTRAGISHADDAINSCFNFAEQLALATFRAQREADDPIDFAAFKRDYDSHYIIEKSLLNRLTHKEYGIITIDGKFKHAYMYYFFLGKMLATNADLAETYIPELCDHSDTDGNHLTLLFAIHHATDDKIIEDILVRMMVELENVPIATLDKDETARFKSIVAKLPKSVLSGGSVEEERAIARRTSDNLEEAQDDEPESQEHEETDGDPLRMLRTFKNNKILGQVLRNQAGKLPRDQIEVIVETISDSSFRLINLILKDEDEIVSLAEHFHAKFPEADLNEVQQMVRSLSFLWTLVNIEQAVHAVNVPSIREAVETVVNRNGTPAYDIFGYFCKLDSGETLTSHIRDHLAELYKKHDDDFVKRVLSLRTQSYMNTHRSKTSVEQSICSVLEIQYRPRLMLAEARIA
ncbi:MAG: toll/interleukin-1 receptor domain-containing protein [Acidimicrobiaceae bacterium]|nr:toll/interleukin-1 receptor domain-containing protein [Acidimicrobiaceae bacterium]